VRWSPSVGRRDVELGQRVVGNPRQEHLGGGTGVELVALPLRALAPSPTACTPSRPRAYRWRPEPPGKGSSRSSTSEGGTMLRRHRGHVRHLDEAEGPEEGSSHVASRRWSLPAAVRDLPPAGRRPHRRGWPPAPGATTPTTRARWGAQPAPSRPPSSNRRRACSTRAALWWPNVSAKGGARGRARRRRQCTAAPRAPGPGHARRLRAGVRRRRERTRPPARRPARHPGEGLRHLPPTRSWIETGGRSRGKTGALRVNGVLRQDGSADDLLSPSRNCSAASRGATLLPCPRPPYRDTGGERGRSGQGTGSRWRWR
jgi:hypothetical protein